MVILSCKLVMLLIFLLKLFLSSTSTLDGKWISAKQLDKASTIHEESVGNFKSGSFLIDLCFVMTSVCKRENVCLFERC
jgi:hypothetical protein